MTERPKDAKDSARAEVGAPGEKADLSLQIQRMGIDERVRLAALADTEVRSILIQDPTREVKVALLNNPRITQAEIERIASSTTVDEEIILHIARKRQWIKNRAILIALMKNPQTPVAASLRFLRLLGDEDLKRVARAGDIPDAVVLGAEKMLVDRQDREAVPSTESPCPLEQGAQPTAQTSVQDEAALRGLTETQAVTEQQRASLFLQIQRMAVGERIRLAISGNKEVRDMLIRDPARQVQVAVINNPRISETEVERIAGSKTMDDEVLRLIIRNRDWIKKYAIKHALVKNPKTPIQASLRFLYHLRDRDLKDVSRNREIPNAVAEGAKKILYERRR